jgi:hypothetical protein
MPRICESIFVATARPDASSLALFTRKPEDKRCNDVANEACEALRLRCVFNETMFVLITEAMIILLNLN